MKLHYMGKFNLDPESLPRLSHEPGAVPFKEAADSKQLGLIANGLALGIYILLIPTVFIRMGLFAAGLGFLPGTVLSLLILFPHELLHAVCFRETVYMYSNLKQGMMFVLGPETMSRTRFVAMSLLPNMVFGVIPFVLFLIRPEWQVLGSMGAFATGMGVGDYYNVYNAMTQMPKGARTYLHGFHSWWYMPQDR